MILRAIYTLTAVIGLGFTIAGESTAQQLPMCDNVVGLLNLNDQCLTHCAQGSDTCPGISLDFDYESSSLDGDVSVDYDTAWSAAGLPLSPVGQCDDNSLGCGGCVLSHRWICQSQDLNSIIFSDTAIPGILSFSSNNLMSILDAVSWSPISDILDMASWQNSLPSGTTPEESTGPTPVLPVTQLAQWYSVVTKAEAGPAFWTDTGFEGSSGASTVLSLVNAVALMTPEVGGVLSDAEGIYDILFPSQSESDQIKSDLKSMTDTIESVIEDDITEADFKDTIDNNTQAASAAYILVSEQFSDKTYSKLNGETFFDAFCGNKNCEGFEDDGKISEIFNQMSVLQSEPAGGSSLPNQFYDTPPTYEAMTAPYFLYNANAYLQFNQMVLNALASKYMCDGCDDITPENLQALYSDLTNKNADGIFDNLIGTGHAIVSETMPDLQTAVNDAITSRLVKIKSNLNGTGLSYVYDEGLLKDTQGSDGSYPGLKSALEFKMSGDNVTKTLEFPGNYNGPDGLVALVSYSDYSDDDGSTMNPQSLPAVALLHGRTWLVTVTQQYQGLWNYDTIVDPNNNAFFKLMTNWTDYLNFLCQSVVIPSGTPSSNTDICNANYSWSP